MQMTVGEPQLWQTAAVRSVVILSDNCIRPFTPPLDGNYKQVRS